MVDEAFEALLRPLDRDLGRSSSSTSPLLNVVVVELPVFVRSLDCALTGRKDGSFVGLEAEEAPLFPASCSNRDASELTEPLLLDRTRCSC